MNLGHKEFCNKIQEGVYWIVTYRTMSGEDTKVFTIEGDADKFIKTL